jgi:hypothetical protein
MIDKNFNPKSDIYSFGSILFECKILILIYIIVIHESTPWSFDEFDSKEELYTLIKKTSPTMNEEKEKIKNKIISERFKEIAYSW